MGKFALLAASAPGQLTSFREMSGWPVKAEWEYEGNVWRSLPLPEHVRAVAKPGDVVRRTSRIDGGEWYLGEITAEGGVRMFSGGPTYAPDGSVVKSSQIPDALCGAGQPDGWRS